MTPFESNFDRFLNAALHKYKISQKELAEMSGLRPASISDFANGKKAPSFENIVRIADALRLSLSDFFAVTIDDNVSYEGTFLSAVKNVLRWFDEQSQFTGADGAEEYRIKLASGLYCSFEMVDDIISGRISIDDRTRRKIAGILGFPGKKYGEFLQIGSEYLNNGDGKNIVNEVLEREKSLQDKLNKMTDLLLEKEEEIKQLKRALNDRTGVGDAEAAVASRPVKQDVA